MKRILLTGDWTDRHVTVRNSYVQALRRVGAVSAAGFAENDEEARALAQLFDALVVTGGDDVEPSLYGRERHPMTQPQDEKRDRSDCCLIRAFLREGKPILGICRGCQIGNVYFGGTLVQHVPEIAKCTHPDNDEGHEVIIEEGSVLAGLLGSGECHVNSYHHQAMEEAGKGLKITACAEDGILEAAEGENVLLVQWHPELMGEDMAPLFRWVCSEK